MIIPLSDKEIKAGDTIITTTDIKSDYYMITCGHEFLVKSVNLPYRRLTLKDFDSDLIIEDVYADYVTLKISFNEAEYIYTNKKEIETYTRYLSNVCPYTETGYSDREEFIRCTSKELNYYGCSPKLFCSKYLTTEQIKDCKSLEKHLRKSKISKINKNDNVKDITG